MTSYLKILAGLLVSMAFMGSPASAAVLTDGSENQLKKGASLTAESEGKTELHPPIGSINCEKSHVGGKTTNDGAMEESVNVNLEALSWSNCNATVTVLAKGTLSIAWTSENDGTLYSTGAEVTVEYLGFHCIFKTNVTSLGPLTGGTPATLDISATIPRTGGKSGAFCGSTAAWTGAYKFTNPSTMIIDNENPARVTVLTDGSENQLEKGASLTAESEGTTTLHPVIGSINCEKSHVGGKSTNDGGAEGSVHVKLEVLSWSSCNATVSVLQKGTLSIVRTGGSNGTLYSTGAEVTVEYLGFHCIFKTNVTSLGPLTGGTPATLDISATIPRTGGRSGAFCGSTAQWTGAYKFTNPSTMDIDAPENTVLTDGSGAQLKTGTSLTAESEGTTVLHPPSGEVKCEAAHFGGQTTNDGGSGSGVSADIQNSTWSKCNATVTVLAKGTLSIKAIGGGNATLTSSGTELTIVSGGLHCIFRTGKTELGTITGSSTTEGNATLDIEATIPRTGGTSGSSCGSSAQWTGAYEFTSPSTLNIDP